MNVHRLSLERWAFGAVLDFEGGLVSLLLIEAEWRWPWRQR